MHLLTINLYQFGEFLRIALWILLPFSIICMLVTTWVHYRRKLQPEGGLRLAIEGFKESLPAEGGYEGTAAARDNGQVDKREEYDEDHKENIYQGILWMKEKYEQYRDLADQRYDQLRQELGRAEQRYQVLLQSLEAKGNLSLGITPAAASASVVMGSGEGEVLPVEPPAAVVVETLLTDVNASRGGELEAQYQQARNELDARQVVINELEGQLRAERQKVEELVGKLQASTQLIQTIYEELDRSLQISRQITLGK